VTLANDVSIFLSLWMNAKNLSWGHSLGKIERHEGNLAEGVSKRRAYMRKIVYANRSLSPIPPDAPVLVLL
jgi:hypothetical protein